MSVLFIILFRRSVPKAAHQCQKQSAGAPAMQYGLAQASSDVVERLRTLADISQAPWRASTVYDGSEERVSSGRSSTQKLVKDSRVFDVVERDLLPLLRSQTSFVGLRLVRNHVDYVRSVPGNSFREHQDFELLAGRSVRSLILVLCFAAPDAGGALVLWPGKEGEAVVIYAPGSLVLFAARTPHAALPVIRGEKLLLKFDVVACEDLCSLRVLRAPSSALNRVRVTVGRSVLRHCDAFAAMLAFPKGEDSDTFWEAALSGEVDTDMVSKHELDILLDFYLARARAGAQVLEDLKLVLGRLCCAEASLSLHQLDAMQERGCALLTGENDAALFAGPRVFHLVFMACAHRKSSFSDEHVGIAPRERESSWSIGGGGGRAVFRASSFSPHRALPLFGNDQEGGIASSVIDREVCYLEGLESEDTGSCCGRQSAEHATALVTRKRALLEQALPAADFLTLSQLEVLAPFAAAALQTAEPANQMCASFREEEECNAGDTYTVLRYETTFIRHGYLLVDPRRLGCAADVSESERRQLPAPLSFAADLGEYEH